jgi:hypothetical protein
LCYLAGIFLLLSNYWVKGEDEMEISQKYGGVLNKTLEELTKLNKKEVNMKKELIKALQKIKEHKQFE